jgi:hypothetical protein
MRKKLTTGNRVALVLEKPLLDQLALDEKSALARRRMLSRIMETLDEKYGGVFRRLAE